MTTPATIGMKWTSISNSTAGAISRYGITPGRCHQGARRGPAAEERFSSAAGTGLLGLSTDIIDSRRPATRLLAARRVELALGRGQRGLDLAPRQGRAGRRLRAPPGDRPA